MKTLLQTVAVLALCAGVAVAEPVKLDNAQLDTVGAGFRTVVTLDRSRFAARWTPDELPGQVVITPREISVFVPFEGSTRIRDFNLSATVRGD